MLIIGSVVFEGQNSLNIRDGSAPFLLRVLFAHGRNTGVGITDNWNQQIHHNDSINQNAATEKQPECSIIKINSFERTKDNLECKNERFG